MKGASRKIISVVLSLLILLPAPQVWAGPCYGLDPCDQDCPDHCTREECGPPDPCDGSCPDTYDPLMLPENTRSWHYTYDGLNRLIAADFGALNEDDSAIVPDPYVPKALKQSWALDSLGNWSADPVNGSFLQSEDTDGDGLYGTDDDPAESATVTDQPVDMSNQIEGIDFGYEVGHNHSIREPYLRVQASPRTRKMKSLAIRDRGIDHARGATDIWIRPRAPDGRCGFTWAVDAGGTTQRSSGQTGR